MDHIKIFTVALGVIMLVGVKPAFPVDLASNRENASETTVPTLLLAMNGQSEFRIVMSQSASPSERHAAEELQMFLEQIC
nr:hypothetical protein [bacterium]